MLVFWRDLFQVLQLVDIRAVASVADLPNANNGLSRYFLFFKKRSDVRHIFSEDLLFGSVDLFHPV